MNAHKSLENEENAFRLAASSIQKLINNSFVGNIMMYVYDGATSTI